MRCYNVKEDNIGSAFSVILISTHSQTHKHPFTFKDDHAPKVEKQRFLKIHEKLLLSINSS